MLLILCAPAVSLAQGAVRDAGRTERFLFGQRLILGMLAALIAIAVSRRSGDPEERQHPDDRAA
jgi:hypothetical protein